MQTTTPNTAPRHSHGCCADKACNTNTCMELPSGKTCGHCVHERRCCAIYGHTPSDTYCDWFPRRFAEKPAQSEQGAAA